MCEYFHSTNLFKCPSCRKELRNYMQELKDKVSTIPKERKQLFLNYLKEGNIGQAVARIDPDKEFESVVWFQIVSDQITINQYETVDFVAK